jgi:hypothetical protein
VGKRLASDEDVGVTCSALLSTLTAVDVSSPCDCVLEVITVWLT